MADKARPLVKTGINQRVPDFAGFTLALPTHISFYPICKPFFNRLQGRTNPESWIIIPAFLLWIYAPDRNKEITYVRHRSMCVIQICNC